jgi:hypothetical protein
MSSKPTMHCQNEILQDTQYEGFIPDETIFKWFHDRYSTSKHLLSLYSFALGLEAKTILEIGFGRSSFVLAKAAHLNKGILITCDKRDFSYLLNKNEKKVSTFVNDSSNSVWPLLEEKGVDFVFLDYFSSAGLKRSFVKNELMTCLQYLKQNGIVCIHDTLIEKYQISRIINQLKRNSKGLLAAPKYEILSLPFNYGLSIIRRISESKYGTLKDNFVKKPETL